MTCKARQYSDQMHCDQCGLQWDVNDDDPPPCDPTGVQVVKEYYNQSASERAIYKIKGMFKDE